MLDLAFEPDRRSREPVYRQLEAHLRDLVQTRRLRPAERLPASRELAGALGLSRNTVNQAYQALGEDGLLVSHVGRGTFVTAGPGLPPAPSAGPAAGRAFAWSGLLARRARGLALPAALRGEAHAGPFRWDFRGGQTDLASLPLPEMRRAYARALGRLPELAEQRDPRGLGLLREAVAASLAARGIRCGADDVAIVNGAQQALDLVARALIDPGDTVVMEQPGYFGAAAAFRASEAHLLGVGVDAEGLRTEELARILRARRVKLLFTTPAAQSPTGVVLSAGRRRELLALADEYQLPVVEDDYDSELRYGGPPTPALKELDTAGQVVYLGTFTKALFGGLRVGYVVAPPPLLTRLVLARWACDVQTDLLAQAALAELLLSGALERHVRRVRKRYAARRSALLAALAEKLPQGTTWVEPAGGNAVWVTLPPDVDAGALSRASREAGIAYTPGELFHLDGSGGQQLSLCFARLEEPAIEAGIERLGALAHRARRRKPR